MHHVLWLFHTHIIVLLDQLVSILLVPHVLLLITGVLQHQLVSIQLLDVHLLFPRFINAQLVSLNSTLVRNALKTIIGVQELALVNNSMTHLAQI
jgi:hypothetical protein